MVKKIGFVRLWICYGMETDVKVMIFSKDESSIKKYSKKTFITNKITVLLHLHQILFRLNLLL